ncbi:hypothetical protein QGM71_08465 [Virgibacillus sp. C22-A2]|uniref:Uncharacterized protein n=1 Tax=Virgibacillus tibetensis TaxID=3042313 RepID=A0ABU6KF60_9BACI|nr:hypothetical protein [Virgibacillus sp. C22-A2]
MTADKVKGFIGLGATLSIVGLILLFSSISFGTSLADGWLVRNGGMSDSSIYELRVNSYTTNFLAFGSITFAIGLFTTIWSSYKLLADHNENEI